MSIQIIIQGNHTTDVLAEIDNLATALTGPTGNVVSVEPDQGIHKLENDVVEKTEVKVKPPADPINEPEEVKTEEVPKAKKPSAKEQDAIVERLIKDEVTNGTDFDSLTKARQKKVEDALKAPEADVDSMFDNEPDAKAERTIDDIRDIMGKIAKDENGDPIQDNLIKIRETLTGFVPEGSEVKVGNVPAEKITELYAELSKIEA